MAEANKQVTSIKPDLGLSDEAVAKTIEHLQQVLADEHVLYMRLRNFHWNVTGEKFISLHELFEEQYNGINDEIDEIAERVRAHGGYAMGTLQEMLEHTRLEETPANYPPARDMIATLAADHEAMVRYLRDAIEVMDDIDNVGTEDYFTGLMQKHQNMAWMLRAHLEG